MDHKHALKIINNPRKPFSNVIALGGGDDDALSSSSLPLPFSQSWLPSSPCGRCPSVSSRSCSAADAAAVPAPPTRRRRALVDRPRGRTARCHGPSCSCPGWPRACHARSPACRPVFGSSTIGTPRDTLNGWNPCPARLTIRRPRLLVFESHPKAPVRLNDGVGARVSMTLQTTRMRYPSNSLSSVVFSLGKKMHGMEMRQQ